MNNFYNEEDVSQIIRRIDNLTSTSQRQWGKMNVAQMLAHWKLDFHKPLRNMVTPTGFEPVTLRLGI